MRAVGLHPDVVVATSRFWQTTCTLVRSGDEAFCIDSPTLPDELEILPAIAEQAGFRVVGRFATHADWDHLLGGYAFPDAPLGVAESTALRLRNEPGTAQRELREFDDQNYVAGRGPLPLGGIQPMPVPGRLSLGPEELELHPADGHTPDGTAYAMPWLGVLVCGDYLSPVEIPWISEGGSLDAYLPTLERLRGLVQEAEMVIPGHGGPLARDEALRVLEEDVVYLSSLRTDGLDAQLPAGRRTGAQKRIHEENVERASR